MIIQIDKSVIESLENSDMDDLDAISFIDDLCRLRRQGHVLIDMPKKLSLKAKSSDKISSLNRVIFSKITEEMTFNRQVLDNIDQKTTYYSSAYLSPETTYNIQESIDIVGYVNSDSPLMQPKLVLEDIEDFKVYNAIASWCILQHKELAGLRISCNPLHGGGLRTANVCEHEHTTGNLVYSICDSDKTSPTCSLGRTARAVQEFFSRYNISSNFHIIDAHEVENLIPDSVMTKCARPTQLPAIQFIKFAVTIKANSYLYYDFKEGFKYNQIYNNTTSLSHYWLPIYDSHSEIQSIKDEVTAGNINENSVMFNKLSSMLPHAVNKIETSCVDEL